MQAPCWTRVTSLSLVLPRYFVRLCAAAAVLLRSVALSFHIFSARASRQGILFACNHARLRTLFYAGGPLLWNNYYNFITSDVACKFRHGV